MNLAKRSEERLEYLKPFALPFNLYRSATFALIPLGALILLLAGLFGGPFSSELTLQEWAKSAPADFVYTASQELAEVPGKGSNGPPYNSLDEGEHLGPINLQRLGGLDIPINPAQEFVIGPLKVSQDEGVFAAIGELRNLAAGEQKESFSSFVEDQKAALGAALGVWERASADQRKEWAKNYLLTLDATGYRQDVADDPAIGPVRILTQALLYLAQAGILDGLMTTKYSVHPSDFTAPALFLGDGKYFAEATSNNKFNENKMALTNGIDSFPGQFWLRPYSLWYAIKPFSTSKNADIEVFAIMVIYTLFFIYLPKIPLLNQLPRLLPFHPDRRRRRGYLR
ncbi:MAG: hypothetical protein Q8L08_10625 [Candidatus Nanopelagicaceae bacterium]|nr:hypothetical protein [Candidatus Nanopelagicaceae bacterium]